MIDKPSHTRVIAALHALKLADVTRIAIGALPDPQPRAKLVIDKPSHSRVIAARDALKRADVTRIALGTSVENHSCGQKT